MTMSRQTLDKELIRRQLATSRSQADDIIRRGFVLVEGKCAQDPSLLVDHTQAIKLLPKAQFVSRAGEKLYTALRELKLNFKDQIVLDVGSSTGGFSEVALRQGASKVIAVDVGSNQLHTSLRTDSRIELHEGTDIRDFAPSDNINIVLIDVSFISLKEILPYLAKLLGPKAQIIAMVKPQFEAKDRELLWRGVIKNNRMRRDILKDFESWIKPRFITLAKADSKVAGAKGNVERFYKLRAIA